VKSRAWRGGRGGEYAAEMDETTGVLKNFRDLRGGRTETDPLSGGVVRGLGQGIVYRKKKPENTEGKKKRGGLCEGAGCDEEMRRGRGPGGYKRHGCGPDQRARKRLNKGSAVKFHLSTHYSGPKKKTGGVKNWLTAGE